MSNVKLIRTNETDSTLLTYSSDTVSLAIGEKTVVVNFADLKNHQDARGGQAFVITDASAIHAIFQFSALRRNAGWGGQSSMMGVFDSAHVFAIQQIDNPTSLDDYIFTVAASSDFSANVACDDSEGKKATHYVPVFDVQCQNAIAAEGIATVTLTAKRFDGSALGGDIEAYVEMLSGQSSHKRVKLINGVGSFRIAATLLSPGECVRFKVGHRYFSGVADTVIEVV